MTEENIQKSIVLYLNRHGYIAFMTLNGVYLPNVGMLQKLKALGFRAGISDLIVFNTFTGEVTFLEVKSLRGRQSEEQKKFEAMITKLGNKKISYKIVRCLDSVKTLFPATIETH